MKPGSSTHASEAGRPEFKSSLRRSLVRTVILLTVIPLTAMGLAAYLRSSALLRSQAVAQMQTLLRSQLDETVLWMKVKTIRLERLTNRTDLTLLLQQALHANRQSPAFSGIRSQFLNEYQAMTGDEQNPIFDQILIVRPNGKVLISSREDWEGLSLEGTPLYQKLSSPRPATAAIYDFPDLYPGQFAVFTVQPYITSTGSNLGSVIGVTEASTLSRVLQPLVSLLPSGEAYFVTSAGQLIGADRYTGELALLEPSPQQQAVLQPAFAGLMQAPGSPASLRFNLADQSRVIAQAQWVPAMDTGVVLQVRESVILGEINSLVPFTILVVIGTLLAMALVIGAGINRLINPVLALTGITRRFAEGDLSERAAVQSDDEIGLLSHSFNQMADELGILYRSLEEKVDERTRQIRTAAEVAQRITASSNLDELMATTTRLIVERFGYYHSGVFLLDRAGKYAVIRAAHGPTARELISRGHQLEVGSTSIIGWVAANNRSRVASDVGEDPMHFRNTLLPNTRAEAAIPIASGEHVFGVLDVQSTEPDPFDPEAVTVLSTLANQIAAAIQNSSQVESAQVNFQELERLYRASRQIAQAGTAAQVLAVIAAALAESPYLSVLVSPAGTWLRVSALNDPQGRFTLDDVHRDIPLSPADAVRLLAAASIFDLSADRVPEGLAQLPTALACQSAAYIPILEGGELRALVMIGSRGQRLTRSLLQSYFSMADLASITMDKLAAAEATDRRMNELNALASISQTLSGAAGSGELYPALHRQVQSVIGDYAFSVALYDSATDTIQIPYTYEDGRVSHVEPFPLGEGLSSILIRTRRPLLLAHDTEKQAIAMGARVVGRPAQSWMGAPMILNNQPIGALIVQDLDREGVFTQEHLDFLSAISTQLAGVMFNLRLLEDSRLRALQLETAAEIARDISSSLNLDELLAKAVSFIRERFSFYHAAIFLLDEQGEYAVIREATGDAGAQMKRLGHKLGVGSKSIVGYVAGRGEPLVIAEAAKDPTYYANPLLPETRGEAALPLKIGDRILGVLDVQTRDSYAFNQDNLRTLQILADQLAIAVVNSELFAETQEHLSQHRLLHHITTTAASGTTLEEALSSAVNGLQVTLGGDRVAILLLDAERGQLRIQAAVGYSEDASSIRIPLGKGVTGWVASRRQSLRIDNTAEDPRYIQLSANTRAELAIPLIYRNELLGVLNVESEQVGAYTDSDEEMLGTLAGSLAAIIANARLLEQIRSQAERERLLYEVTGRIRRSTDIETILSTTAGELARIVGAQRTRIRIDPLEPGPVEDLSGNGQDQGRQA
ncbi:MAG TPA: GAF domain-containing protein [Anaerolineales bacterium]